MKLKLIINILIGLCTLRHFRAPCFANEDATQEGITAANEFKLAADNWVMLSPYGDFPNTKGLQRFRKEDAANIVSEFDSLLSAPARKLGLPWYIGHPDHPEFEEKYRDTRAYGRIKKLEARDDGLFANVKWSAEGKRLVEEEAFHGHSVNWRMRQNGNVWHPFSLKSVGFTNKPGIPVTPVTAANEEQSQMKKDKVIQILGLAADATDEQIETAIKDAHTKAGTVTAANEKATTAETALATERQTVGTLNGKVTTAETNFANERKARVALLIDGGIKAGKILPAEKAQWEADFANEFEKTVTKLAGAKAKLHTKSVTEGLARNSESRNRQEQIQEAVNELMTKSGRDYHTAYMSVKRKHPDWFEGAIEAN